MESCVSGAVPSSRCALAHEGCRAPSPLRAGTEGPSAPLAGVGQHDAGWPLAPVGVGPKWVRAVDFTGTCLPPPNARRCRPDAIRRGQQ